MAIEDSKRKGGALRFIACSTAGSASTLIGRLLSETGHRPGAEQALDILFSTPKRQFVFAGGLTSASNSSAAVLLADAGHAAPSEILGLCRMLSMLEMRHLVLAVDRMDLVGWDESVFSRISTDFSHFAGELGFSSVHAIPLSSSGGENVAERSGNASWYEGPSLLEHLEKLEASEFREDEPFSMVVQQVDRHNPAAPGFFGRMTCGVVRSGDRVRIAPGGIVTKIRSASVEGEFVVLQLEDEIDIEKGSVIASCESPVELSDQFEARVICLGKLVPGRPYLLEIHESRTNAAVTEIKYAIDAETGAHLAAKTLEMNDIGVVNLSTSKPIPFEPYKKNRLLGSFTLTDKASGEAVALGMIDFALRRASNIHWQGLSIDRQARAALKHQKPRCLWFTGLSGSGKSTIANLLEKKLYAMGRHTYILDGDNVRHGLNRDLGFTEADRVENIRRVAEVSKLMVDAGLIVIVSFLSPFRSERDFARSLFAEGEFLEIYVDTPFDECERRDTKGLYAKARRGELKNFTGLDSPYEPPLSPEIRLETVGCSAESCVENILGAING